MYLEKISLLSYLLIDEEAASKRKAVLRVDKLLLILLLIDKGAAGTMKAVLRVHKLLLILPSL